MITCEQHDYIEIVCTFHYPISLTMKSGVVIDCIALDTKSDKNRKECIKVKIQNSQCLVILDDIALLKVRVNNPHFQLINFTNKQSSPF